jgi:two-component system chemotaxis response regulator CheB
MHKNRVMIVDGEIHSRRLIGRAIEHEDSLELVGTCALGQVVLEKIDRLQPDLILLGISGSHEVGLETLARIRSSRRDLPVIIASAHANRGTPLSLEALSSGATACVSFPSEGETVTDAEIDNLRIDIVSIIRRCLPQHLTPYSNSLASDRASGERQAFGPVKGPIEAVVIGVSTGGPNALAATIPSLPADLPVPVLIVQHMPEYFIPSLADRLNQLSALPVRVASAGAEASAGTAWIAPWGVHLELKRDNRGLRLALNDGPEENLCRPSVDVLFRSAARVLDGRVLGVVLTGMGCDGLRGSREIRASGGMVIVQDESTSVIKGGMRGSVAEAGLAQKILPLSEIGPEIVRIAWMGRTNMRSV